MVDETEPGPGASKNGALVERAAIGWDPYEVWRTRIRPHQKSHAGRGGQPAPVSDYLHHGSV